MEANLLDDGIGNTLVSPEFDDVTFIGHGKRVYLRTRIKELVGCHPAGRLRTGISEITVKANRDDNGRSKAGPELSKLAEQLALTM